MVQHGPTGNLIPGPTEIGQRNTPHLVQLYITWTGPRSNGPSDLVQGRHLFDVQIIGLGIDQFF